MKSPSWTLVTGGAKRLGAEICRTLADAGHSIAIHYRSSSKEAEALAEECREKGVEAACIQGDFSKPDTTQAFVEAYLKRFPSTAYVIHNVGEYLILPALQTTVSQWGETFQTNVLAPIAITNALVPSLKECRGAILNVGTVGLHAVRPDQHASAYKASKQVLWFLTQTWAQALAPFDISVNMVSPGMLDITVDLPKNPLNLPMHRMGTCAEVARTVAFLLDPKNHYITGQNIEVAGAFGM